MGIRFLAAGARRYVGVDPFYSVQDTSQQQRIYAALREQLSPAEQTRFDRAVDLSSGIRFDPERLHRGLLEGGRRRPGNREGGSVRAWAVQLFASVTVTVYVVVVAGETVIPAMSAPVFHT